MRRQRGSSWSKAVFGFALLALAVVLAVTALPLRAKGGVPDAVNLAALATFALSIPPLVASLWSWYRRSASPVPVTSADLAAAKDVLAGLVEQQWQAEAVLRSLDDPDPMPVQWHVSGHDAVMDRPANLTPGSLLLTASSDAIAALVGEFRAMRRRRLVILGGPGTGKTTLAVLILRELLATRSRPGSAGEPVPVLLSIAGWDPGATPQLQDWVAARLAQDYPALRAASLSAGMPAALAARGQVLPVLDGLDELPPQARAAAIAALNRSLADTSQLIVTCRTADYRQAVHAAGDVLTSALVIEPRPLEPAAGAGYLERCLPPQPGCGWEQLLARLRAAPAWPEPGWALADTAATPLGLWLLRAVYATPRSDPSSLLEPGRFASARALRAHLFDQLIPALIAARPPGADPAGPFCPRRSHDPAQVRRWLGYLAHRLSADGDGPGTRDFAWWHLARATDAITRRTRFILGLMAGLTVGIAAAISFGIASSAAVGWNGSTNLAALMYGLTSWPSSIWLAFGLAAGLLSGLVVGRSARSWSRDPPGFADLRARGRVSLLAKSLGASLVKQAPAGVAFGVTAGILVAVTVAFTFTFGVSYGNGPNIEYQSWAQGRPLGVEAGIWLGCAGWLMLGLVTGLTKWTETPSRAGSATTPLASWRTDRALHLLRMVACGLAFGLICGIALSQLNYGIARAVNEAQGSFSHPPFAGSPESAFALVLMTGTVAGLAAGIVTGYAAGRHHAWASYLIATWRLARAGLLPRRLMLFMDDAHRLGLLRAVGPIYQIRHAEFHDYLAATYEPPPKVKPRAPAVVRHLATSPGRTAR